MTDDRKAIKPDIFTSLDLDVIAQIEIGLKKNYRTAAPAISNQSWQKLKPILAQYCQDVEEIRGALNKGQAQLLVKTAKRARNLLDDLARIKTEGLSVFLDVGPGGLEIETLELALENLSARLSVHPAGGKGLKDVSRENLYFNFVQWWRHATGENPWIEEGRAGEPPPTPFMFVANEVFNLPSMPGPTGASYKSLKDLQRALRRRDQKLARLGEMLSKLSLGNDSDGGG